MDEPPRRDKPINMMRTLICSHCRNVRSFAKKVFGSTLVRTSAFALQLPNEICQGSLLAWLQFRSYLFNGDVPCQLAGELQDQFEKEAG